MRLGLLVPSLDMVMTDFMVSMTAMLVNLMSNRVEGVGGEFRFKFYNQRGSLVDYSREDLLTRAIDQGMTHVLWLDSDMVFPGNVFHQLWDTMREGEHPAVACNYVKKCIPTTANTQSLDEKMLITTKNHTGTEPVLSVGFGVFLLDCSVMKDIPRPWFDGPWIEGEDQEPGKMLHKIGEDVYFCKKLHKYTGKHVIVNHDASQEVGHIGTFCYDNNLADVAFEDEPELRKELVAGG